MSATVRPYRTVTRFAAWMGRPGGSHSPCQPSDGKFQLASGVMKLVSSIFCAGLFNIGKDLYFIHIKCIPYI